jgi:hypothetical protein
MSCVFFQELPKTGGLYCKRIFDETIILQDSWKTHMHYPI